MGNPAQWLPSAAYRKAGIILANVSLDGDRAGAAANYNTFFVAPYKCVVLSVRAIWGTASVGGTLDVERLQGTEAHDAGDDLLLATIDMSGAADTVNAGTLTATVANLELAAGNRLGLVDGGNIAAQRNLTVTVELAPIP